MNRVLDACALIAYFRGETGSDVMARIIIDQQSTCFAHALNVSEVFRDFLLRDGEEEAERVYLAIRLANITIREDFDEALWKDAARRKAAHRMSLADSIGIALAYRLSADFVSTDHHELDAVNDSGAYVITFIR